MKTNYSSMQKFILLLSLSFVFGCNNNSTSKTAGDSLISEQVKRSDALQDTSVKKGFNDPAVVIDSNYKHWKVGIDTATEMISKYSPSCKHTRFDVDAFIKSEIDKAFPDVLYDKGFVAAKHFKTNQDKYATLRGMKPGGKNAEVNGLCTLLYKVLSRNKAATVIDEEYYDIGTICPPPRGENCLKEDTKN